MSDHRMKYDLDTDNLAIAVEVIDRSTEEVVDTETFSLADVDKALVQTITLYGFSKALQDRASSEPSGPSKLAEMRTVAQQFADGVWQRERKSGPSVVSAEVEALAQLKGVSVAAAQGALKQYDKEQREAILANEAIVAKAAEIRAAREASTAVDLSDLANVA